jgi:secondary thiamine-phosphate synthase enzyme
MQANKLFMIIQNYSFSLQTLRREHFVPITDEVVKFVKQSGVVRGYCKVYIPHTTAAVSINENADPDVVKDIIMVLNELIPQQRRFLHSEGNSDAHVKSSLMGVSLDVPIERGKLVLGQWQGIYFCEFDGPRTRNVHLVILGEKAS